MKNRFDLARYIVAAVTDRLLNWAANGVRHAVPDPRVIAVVSGLLLWAAPLQGFQFGSDSAGSGWARDWRSPSLEITAEFSPPTQGRAGRLLITVAPQPGMAPLFDHAGARRTVCHKNNVAQVRCVPTGREIPGGSAAREQARTGIRESERGDSHGHGHLDSADRTIGRSRRRHARDRGHGERPIVRCRFMPSAHRFPLHDDPWESTSGGETKAAGWGDCAALGYLLKRRARCRNQPFELSTKTSFV